MPTTFKFVASKSLKNLPLIGQQLVGGKHVLIDRKTRKGQLNSFKASFNWLKKGVQIMAYAARPPPRPPASPVCRATD